MKILVTGATGFLGTTLCRHLASEGHDLVQANSRNCDLTQQGSLDKLTKDSFDRIFHLAAWTQAGDFPLKHPGEQWILNQQINTNMLEWWHRCQPQAKMIVIGTSCAYEPGSTLEEKDYLTGAPHDSLFSYVMTKRMLYIGLLALNRQFGHNYLQLVPSTLYGPDYHTDGRQMHFIFDLVRKIVRGKLYGEPVVLWGDGYQKRELVYVDDFVRIMTQLSDKVSNEVINVGAGQEFTIRHFAEIICKEVGFDFAKVHFDTTRYVGATSKCLSTKKIRTLVDSYDLLSLEKGLSRVIAWQMEAEKNQPAVS